MSKGREFNGAHVRKMPQGPAAVSQGSKHEKGEHQKDPYPLSKPKKTYHDILGVNELFDGAQELYSAVTQLINQMILCKSVL